MFHLKPRDELVCGNPTSDNYIYDELLFMDNGFGITTERAGNSSNGVVKKRSGAESGEDLRKKAMHRDIERKRRQEMSQLYDILRSLIPCQHLEGKRSISDLMNEAMRYTKQLEKNVQESRDKLRRLSHTKIGSDNHVRVQQEQHEIEILINTSTSEFGLSRVMIELVDRKLDVVNCVSTKSDDFRFLHKILAQANDTRLVDIPVLQQKLTE